MANTFKDTLFPLRVSAGLDLYVVTYTPGRDDLKCEVSALDLQHARAVALDRLKRYQCPVTITGIGRAKGFSETLRPSSPEAVLE